MTPTEAPACAVEGMLTIHQAAVLREQLLAACESGSTTLDLRAVTECDTAGVQLLLALDHSLQRQGRRLQLQNLPPVVQEALRRCGLDAMLA